MYVKLLLGTSFYMVSSELHNVGIPEKLFPKYATLQNATLGELCSPVFPEISNYGEGGVVDLQLIAKGFVVN